MQTRECAESSGALPEVILTVSVGLGQIGATGLSNFFIFWVYLTPILGAIVADQYLGKYNTILYFAMVYIVGLIILFCTSLPVAIEHGAALGGLIAAMIIIGLGTGGIKSNVSPLIAEQYRGTKQTIRTEKSGERVIVDPAVTIQRICTSSLSASWQTSIADQYVDMVFYLCINVGSLSSIATTELERNVGFWSAYLLPLLMFLVGFAVIIAGYSLPTPLFTSFDAHSDMWLQKAILYCPAAKGLHHR